MKIGHLASAAMLMTAVVCAALTSCSASSESNPAPASQTPVCTAGTTRACQCPGGEASTETCAANGMYWEACACPDVVAGGGTGGSGTTTCIPGNTEACTCPDGAASFRTCSAAGVWEACQCPDTGAGGTPGAGGTAAGGTAAGGTSAGGTSAGGTAAGGTAAGGTAAGGTAAGGTAAGGTAAGGTGTGGDATGGDAGAAPVVKDCDPSVKTTLTSGTITDWEDYDGATTPSEWAFPFNGTAEDATAVWAGPYEYNDETGEPFFGMVAGNSSNYALGISNTLAEEWGGGLGLWMGCVDATSFTGIQFYVRGSTPLGTATLSLAMEDTSPPAEDNPDGGGTCIATDPESDTECQGPSYEFTVTDAWTLVQIPFSSFTAGTAAEGVSVTATGDEITGFTVNVNLEWIEDPENEGTWIPVSAAYEFVMDDLAFY